MSWKYIGGLGPYDTKAEVDAKILIETNRAKAVEEALQDDIDTNAGKTAELDADLTGVGNRVSDIESKIPESASGTNKLATIADVEAGGLTEVKHDASLVGLGTTADPLKVDIPVPTGGTSGQVLTQTEDGPAWEDLPADVNTDNNGLEGDYCSRYGIDDETKSGLPYIKAVGSKVVVFPALLQFDMPGVQGLTILGSDIEYEVQSTDNPQLFLLDIPINGSRIIESTDVFFSETEPENGATGYAAWWDGTEFRFKSNDTGNVWRPANAVRAVKTVFTDGSLTRLCFTGCRLLNKQEFATKQQLSDGLSGKADNTTVSELTSELSTKATKASDFMTPLTSDNKGATKTEIDALDDKIDIAGTSGKIIGSYWFGKTNASAEVPAPTLVGQNYYDFTTGQVYKSTDGTTWTLDGTNTPPTDIDAQIIISSKFWNIPEQENQHGGKAWWSHTNAEWSYSPTIYEDKPVGATMPILDKKVSTFKFNDVSYLNANTFSWQSGAVYVAAYQHLVDDLSTAGAVQTVTIEGVTISFEVATDGHRICLPTQETAISQLYEKTGDANFFILDIENARFKLPRTQKRKLIRTWKSAGGFSWYNLYSDGFVRQGYLITPSPTSNNRVNLVVPMATKNYVITLAADDLGGVTFATRQTYARETTFVDFYFPQQAEFGNFASYSFEVSGMADSSVLVNEPVQYEYYYVGNFDQSSIEQTAGINAELFNTKADVDLANVSTIGARTAVGWCMPSATYINISLNGSGTVYTAPADGYIAVHLVHDTERKYFNCYVRMNNQIIYATTLHSTNADYNQAAILPIPKGATVTFDYSAIGTLYFCRFIYANGTKPNA